MEGFELRIRFYFIPFNSLATGDTITPRPGFPLENARLCAEAPQERRPVARRIPRGALSAKSYLVTSPREEAGSPPPEDACSFDWLPRTSVRACGPFLVRSERGGPAGGVWQGFPDPAPAP